MLAEGGKTIAGAEEAEEEAAPMQTPPKLHAN